MTHPRRRAFGCLLLLGTPFVLVAIYLGTGAIRLAVRGGPQRAVLLLACSAVLFGLIGLALISVALARRRPVTVDAELQARHPDEPWMWNPEWASRRIHDRSSSDTFALWAFALLWNAIASPVFFLLPEQRLAWVGIVFPLAGLVLLIAAARSTWRALRFRESTLVLDTLPAPLGGTLRGTVEVPNDVLLEASSVFVRLNSLVLRRVGNETTETTFCREEREIQPSMIRRTPNGAAIPIEISVPSNVIATDISTDSQVKWRLTIDADVVGIDYSATFDVPVYRTNTAEFQPRVSTPPLVTPLEPTSYVERSGTEGRELHFPPFRAPSLALWSLLITIFWIGAVAFSVVLGAPVLVPAICALIAFILLLATIDLFIGSRTVVLGSDRIRIRHRLFWPVEKVVLRGEVASTRAVAATQTGARPYYHVDLRTTAGKRIRVAKYIRSKREAEWVAQRIGHH